MSLNGFVFFSQILPLCSKAQDTHLCKSFYQIAWKFFHHSKLAMRVLRVALPYTCGVTCFVGYYVLGHGVTGQWVTFLYSYLCLWVFWSSPISLLPHTKSWRPVKLLKPSDLPENFHFSWVSERQIID